MVKSNLQEVVITDQAYIEKWALGGSIIKWGGTFFAVYKNLNMQGNFNMYNIHTGWIRLIRTRLIQSCDLIRSFKQSCLPH